MTHFSAKTRFTRSCLDGLRCLLSDRRIFLLGGVQALFESVLYVFVFLWTPVLDPHGPPLGIVFSCLMAASMVGSLLYRLATSLSLPSTARPCALPGCADGFLLFLHADLFPPLQASLDLMSPSWPSCCWSWPVASISQHSVFSRAGLSQRMKRASVLAWFRVPLHLLACLGLLALHGEVSGAGGGGGWQRHQTHVWRLCRHDAGSLDGCC